MTAKPIKPSCKESAIWIAPGSRELKNPGSGRAPGRTTGSRVLFVFCLRLGHLVALFDVVGNEQSVLPRRARLRTYHDVARLVGLLEHIPFRRDILPDQLPDLVGVFFVFGGIEFIRRLALFSF